MVIIKSQSRSSNIFCFKDEKLRASSVAHKFQYRICNETREIVKHLVVRSSKHIALSLLTKKFQQKEGSIKYLLRCSYTPSVDKLSLLTRVGKKFYLEIKENLLIIPDERQYQ